MPQCDFNEVAKQLANRTSAWVFCKFAAYIQNIFSQEHLWMAASESCYVFKFLSTQFV